MMAHVRRSFRSVPLLALFALASLAAPLPAAHAAPEGSTPKVPTPSARKERIEELWLDARGESGLVRTVPLYLDDEEAEYRFGPAHCGGKHRLGAETLRALQAAVAQKQPVRIDAAPADEKGRRCITGVAFFAP